MDEKSRYDLTRLAGYYNCGKLRIFGFSQFKMEAGANNTYPTSRSALIVPLQGRADFCFDEQVLHAARGRLLHGCPNHLLTIRTVGEETFLYVVLYYDGKEDLLFSCALPKPDEVFPLVEKIIATNRGTNLQEQYRTDALTEEFLDLIFSEAVPPSILSEQKLLQELVEYIHAHYREALTLQKIADHVGESKSRVSYLFYKHYQIRPIDYLIDYRIEKAVELLRDGASVGQAARSVGYSDALYFSRLFKKRLGFAPSQLKVFD